MDLTLVERPKHVDATDPRRFSIKSGVVRAVKQLADDGSTRYFLEGTANSSIEDRMGDTLDENCQASMLSQSKNLTMWLNHSYNVPEDILGVVFESQLQMATDAKQGDCLDFNIKVEILADNPRAFQAWKSVDKGVKLGFSIGGIFTDFEFKDEDDWWFSGLLVHDIELLEISLVGIPANPRSYTKFVDDMTTKLHDSLKTLGERVKQMGDGAKLPALRALAKKSLLEGKKAEDISIDLAALSVSADEMPAAEAVVEVTEKTADEAVVTEAAPDAGETETKTADGAESEPVVETKTEPPAEEEVHAGPPSLAVAPVTASAAATNEATAVVTQPEAKADESQQTDEAKSGEEVVTGDEAPTEVQPATPKSYIVHDTLTFSGDETFEQFMARAIAEGKATVADPPETKALTHGQVSDTVGAMRSLKAATEHGLCALSMENVRTAHGKMKSLLPTEYEVPGDALLEAADNDAAERSIAALAAKGFTDEQIAAVREAFAGQPWTITVDVDASEATRTVTEAITTLESKRTEVEAAVTAAETKRTELDAEVQALETKLAELKATSTGRRSAQPGVSSKDESGPVVTPEMYAMPTTVAAHKAGAAFLEGSGVHDARSRAT